MKEAEHRLNENRRINPRRRKRKVIQRNSNERSISWKSVAGIDVAKGNFNICVVEPLPSDEGNATLERHDRTLERSNVGLQRAERFLAEYDVKKVALESTSIYHQVIQQYLTTAGIEVIVVNPSLIAPKSRKRPKRDKLDAFKLAKGLIFGTISEHGEFKPSYIPDEIEHKIRRACRLRDSIVRDRTRVKNRIHKVFDRQAIHLRDYFGSSKTIKFILVLQAIGNSETSDAFFARIKTDRTIHPLSRNSILENNARFTKFFQKTDEKLNDLDRIMLKSLVAQLITYNQTIRDLEQNIEEYVANVPPTLTRLKEIAKSFRGVSDGLAIRIVVEFGDPFRFSNRRKAGSYTGLDPVIHSSGGKANIRGISKTGNKHLRRTLYLAAQQVARLDPKYRAYYLRLRSKGRKHTQAICAIGRKLAVVYYSLAKNDREYSVLKNKMKFPHKIERKE